VQQSHFLSSSAAILLGTITLQRGGANGQRSTPFIPERRGSDARRHHRHGASRYRREETGTEELGRRPRQDDRAAGLRLHGRRAALAQHRLRGVEPGVELPQLHESIVNYGGNKKPEFITCLHEESSVAIAHGYFKASGRMMAMMAHGSVGIQHAAMAVYNAWCDRVPVMLIGGNFMDAAQRRPGVEWAHCSQNAAGILRDYIKWDDQPASLQHFAESTVRAYKMAMTPPMEPVMIVADGMLQEHAIEDEKGLSIPKLVLTAPPQGESGAVREAAKLLAAAQNPVIVCERVARSQEGVKLMVELAEALNAPVVDQLGRMNFPTTHYLCRSSDGRALVRDADVILFLEVGDPWGMMNSISDPHHEYRRIAKPDVKTIHVTLADQLMKSNYQDMQRFCPVDISISADAQGHVASLIESVRRISKPRSERTDELGQGIPADEGAHAGSAAVAWDASPVSTARLHAELWNVLKNENWCLAESRSGSWAARLWPATQQSQLPRPVGRRGRRLHRAGGGRRGARQQGQGHHHGGSAARRRPDVRAGRALDRRAPQDSAPLGDAQQPRLPPGSDAPAEDGRPAQPANGHGAHRHHHRGPEHRLREARAGAGGLGRGGPDHRPGEDRPGAAARARGGEEGANPRWSTW
jgi:thiamine pyrophosphate-dependent acetolactate synthase large subunit-like protein